MKSPKSQEKLNLLTDSHIQKQILYWNINALNNITAYSGLIDRVEKKQIPNQHDLQIRDFYFTGKLTIDGKFQQESFLQKSVDYIKNFKSLDKNSYLQSINFQNSLKKYRFWKNIQTSIAKDKQSFQVQEKIKKIVWSYRLPTFLLFTSFIYVFMVGVGFTKMKKGKQLAMLLVSLYIADIFVQRRKSSSIFYSIPPLQIKQLQKQRKDLINQSIVLDGKIFELNQNNSLQKKQLIQQAKTQQNQSVKKLLLQAAGFQVFNDISQRIV